MRHWTAKLILMSLLLKVFIGVAHAAMPTGPVDHSADNSLLKDLAVICTAYGAQQSDNQDGTAPDNRTAWDQKDCALCLLYQGSSPADNSLSTTLAAPIHYNNAPWPGITVRQLRISNLYLPIGQRAPPHSI